jgi:hypothetical protein
VIVGEDLGAGYRRPLGVRRKGRQSRPRETRELIHAVIRLLASIGERMADEDPETLGELVKLSETLQEAILEGVRGLREAEITWEAIGAATGTTRQAAIMKWGPRL